VVPEFAPGEKKSTTGAYVRFDIRDHIRIRVVPGSMTIVEFPDDLYEIEEIEDANKLLQHKPLRASTASKDQLIYSSFGITMGGSGVSADVLRKIGRTTLSIYVRNKKDPARNGWVVTEVVLDERTPHKVVRIEDVGGAAKADLDLSFLEQDRHKKAARKSAAKDANPRETPEPGLPDRVPRALGKETFDAVRTLFGEKL
jgi:hypothetical protein